MAAVSISPRGEARLRHGHPWIYRSDVDAAGAAGGEVVTVRGARDRVLGQAFFSDRSQIALRMVTRDDRPVDEAFWRARLEAALRFRASLAIDASAYRLVHGEADLLPSVIVDRYGEVLVVQTLSQGSDRLLPLLTRLLVELTGATGVVERNDPRVRQLEGLESRVSVVHGEAPEQVAVHEGAIEYDVDVRAGQKTGLFLDQRENHAAAAVYARGRLLDAFSYHGGFALALAAACSSVEALDVSADAVATIHANALRNRLPHVQAREANVFDELRRLEKAGARYDTVVLDPPAFAKNKRGLRQRACRRRRGSTGRGCAAEPPARHPRRGPARGGRARGLPPPAPYLRRADPVPVGPRRRGRPDRRAGAWRGRLHDQALQPARTGGAGEGHSQACRVAETPARQTVRGRLMLLPDLKQLRIDGQPLALTATEYALIERLMARPDHVMTRPQLTDALYNGNSHANDRTTESHLRNLRRKLADAGLPDAVETLHGIGVRMGPCRGA